MRGEYLDISGPMRELHSSLPQTGLVLLFSLTDPEWRGRLECGLAGLTGLTWAGDSRHVITLGDLGVLLTVWSLQVGLYSSLSRTVQRSCYASRLMP